MCLFFVRSTDVLLLGVEEQWRAVGGVGILPPVGGGSHFVIAFMYWAVAWQAARLVRVAVCSALLRLPLFRKLYGGSFAGVVNGMGLRFHGCGTSSVVIRRNTPYARLVFLLGKRVVSRAASGQRSCTLFRAFKDPFIVRPCSLFNVRAGCATACGTHASVGVIAVSGLFMLGRLGGCRVFHLGCLGVLDGETRITCRGL